ncbi:MAG: leucine-rich repeat protein [Clostridia bacterium]|nr:leucine-rich repeat protein [Clostridia bacterium]
MKKILSITLLLVLVFGTLCTFPVVAEDTTHFSYQVLADGTAELKRNYTTAQKLIIPAEIDGRTVTSIGKDAFYNNNHITEVTLPDTIREIHGSAFSNCENLTTINLPENLTYIGDYAFNHCTQLENVNLPDGLTYIGKSAFMFCYKLGHNGLPESLEYIGSKAFHDCDNIESAIIPEGVTYLGDSAFMWCENLTEASLPHTLEYIGSNPFFKTPFANNAELENGAFYCGEYLLDVDNKMEGDFTVKDGTRIIASDTFHGSDLSSISLPDSVEYIGEYCFFTADRLKEIKLSANLKEIPKYAFRDCYNLTSVTIPEGVTAIREDAFWDCRNLSYIKIPNSVETIEIHAVGYDTLWEYKNDCYYDVGKVKSEILTIAGYKGSAAEKYANENGFNFKPLANKYQEQIFEIFDITEEDFGVNKKYHSYHEGYEHYSSPDESTPDFVLIELYENPESSVLEAQAYGDYIIRDCDYYFPEKLGYYIYLPETKEIYTLDKAFEAGIENVYNVFTLGGVGELIGDVNYDRKLNIRDATVIQKDIARIEFIKNNHISDYTWSDTEKVPKYISDYNRDGEMNIRDATAIQKMLAKI